MRVTMILVATVVLFQAGCTSNGQMMKHTTSTDFSLDPVALQNQGIGFLTPVSATGQEADRVGLAIAFADRIAAERADLHVVRLAEVLSAVNQAGLSAAYGTMVEDYLATGILEKETLRQVGEVSGARYLGLLGLARFTQSTNKRFGIAGIRLLDTKLASLRLSWQIWDSETGVICWEGSDEINYAYETSRERPINFAFMAEQAATNLIADFPTITELRAEVPAVAELMATE